jgi:tetratricopeptide (TPR) repeat protein
MSPSISERFQQKPLFWGFSCLFLAIVLAYLPVRANGYAPVDDGGYVYLNPWVLQGLSFEGLRWAFTTYSMNNWHPLTWVSTMLDVSLFGLKPGPRHMHSLLLHVLNALFFYYLLLVYIKNWRCSLFAALLFGLHPVHVESTAWISERKDLLSLLFFWGVLIHWHRFVQGQRWQSFALAMLFQGLSLMAKPMLVTLPGLLLLLDFWFYRRFTGFKSLIHLVLEKVPFLQISLIVAWLTLQAQSRSGGVETLAEFGLPDRMAAAAHALVRYLYHLLYPVNLIPFYEMESSHLLLKGSLSALVLLAIFSAAFFARQRHLLGGLLWLILALVPVLGFVKVGEQAMADRYLYLPALGLYAALAFTLQGRRPNFHGAWFILLAPLAALTLRQVGFWKNSETYHQRILACQPESALALRSLIDLYMMTDRLDKAENLIPRLASQAELPRHQLLFARLDYARQNLDTAEEHYIKATAGFDPYGGIALMELGDLYLTQNRKDEALAAFDLASQRYPGLQADFYGRLEMHARAKDEEAVAAFLSEIPKLPAIPVELFMTLSSSRVFREWFAFRNNLYR